MIADDGGNTLTPLQAADLGVSGNTTIDGGRISAGSTITVGTNNQIQLQGASRRILISD